MERSHRTCIPCLEEVRNTEEFLDKAPFLGGDSFSLFPVVLLDEVAMKWAFQGGHDVLAYYNIDFDPGRL